MEYRKDILWRVYLVYIFMVIFAFAILYRIITVQFVEGNVWREKARQLTTAYVDVAAARGNIFDANGNLLATSLPYYEVGMDVNAPSIFKDTFKKYADSLAYRLSDLFEDKSKKEYLQLLKKARKDHDRYIVLKRNVSYKELQQLKTFPLLRKGKRGGLVYLQTNHRERPFALLASRTIGYTTDKIKVGIEGAYDSTLKGVSGKRLMQKVAADVWRPINDENEIEPKDGNDLYTTIDINIQDVAENALYKTLVKNDASHGCVVLMEVKTGEIKAIANLTRTDSGLYKERLNYAMGHPTEPGSTFKLASLLAAIDDGYVNLDDEFPLENGECYYYNRRMVDAHAPAKPEMSVKEIFEHSSNVGVSKIITKYYAKDPQKFVNKLKSFHLDKKLELGMPGEGTPRIKNVKNKDWYGTTLPWMSIGYESLITPMQTLTLYNAIANNGVMVKPRFIRQVKNNGVIIKNYPVEILNPKIVQSSTVEKAKKMMEGVVENGSGKGLNISAFKVAGKTGTAQIAKAGGDYKTGGKTYQASFVGYFPANNPLYSCIVIVYNPSRGTYYGGLVAGPVFKEIAEKVYSSSIDFQQEINYKKNLLTKAPVLMKGKTSELSGLLASLEIPYQLSAKSDWAGDSGSDSTKIQLISLTPEQSLKQELLPDLSGMSAKDALYLLENKGMNVKILGLGTVKKQLPEAGSKCAKGSQITLILG